MIWCWLQYIIGFTNLAIVTAFCTHFLCCLKKHHRFDTRIKILIVMPFFTALFTAGVAIYLLIINKGAQCILFGSFEAMMAIDLNN